MPPSQRASRTIRVNPMPAPMHADDPRAGFAVESRAQVLRRADDARPPALSRAKSMPARTLGAMLPGAKCPSAMARSRPPRRRSLRFLADSSWPKSRYDAGHRRDEQIDAAHRASEPIGKPWHPCPPRPPRPRRDRLFSTTGTPPPPAAITIAPISHRILDHIGVEHLARSRRGHYTPIATTLHPRRNSKPWARRTFRHAPPS